MWFGSCLIVLFPPIFLVYCFNYFKLVIKFYPFSVFLQPSSSGTCSLPSLLLCRSHHISCVPLGIPTYIMTIYIYVQCLYNVQSKFAIVFIYVYFVIPVLFHLQFHLRNMKNKLKLKLILFFYRLTAAGAGKITLSKVSWGVPHVSPADGPKLQLYEMIEKKVNAPVGFRMR